MATRRHRAAGVPQGFLCRRRQIGLMGAVSRHANHGQAGQGRLLGLRNRPSSPRGGALPSTPAKTRPMPTSSGSLATCSTTRRDRPCHCKPQRPLDCATHSPTPATSVCQKCDRISVSLRHGLFAFRRTHVNGRAGPCLLDVRSADSRDGLPRAKASRKHVERVDRSQRICGGRVDRVALAAPGHGHPFRVQR